MGSADKNPTKKAAPARDMERRDREAEKKAREEGIRIGIRQEREKVVQNMAKKGVCIGDMATYLDLSEDEVKSLPAGGGVKVGDVNLENIRDAVVFWDYYWRDRATEKMDAEEARRQKGRQEERKKIARTMLGKGLAIETVAKYTGLSKDEIESLSGK